MLSDQLNRYVKHMEETRKLSSPNLDTLDAASYSAVLQSNFLHIGQLAEDNRKVLSEVIYPFVDSHGELLPEEAEALITFCNDLINASEVESLDAPIVSLVTDRLLRDATARNDVDYALRELDTQVVAYYALMGMAMRITSRPATADFFRSNGLATLQELLAYLDKDAFAALPSDEGRAIVLTNARYAAVMYEATVPTPEYNEELLDLLDRALALEDDPFYHDAVPGFDWGYYRLRTLEYYAMSTDVLNVRGFDEPQLDRIAQRSAQLRELWFSDPERFGQWVPYAELGVICARNEYLAGDLSADAYRARILRLYQQRDRYVIGAGPIYVNALVPLEYSLSLDPQALTPAQQDTLQMMYENVCDYALRMAKTRSLGFMLEYFSQILEHFIEVPGGITFQQMGLRCMAALHPPTYVHTRMVGKITRCLTEHLVRMRPELFVGVLGLRDAADVTAHADELTDFAQQAALCHDFGKLAIIDTILVYGRSLLEYEFSFIREHPAMGAKMLERNASTAAYAPIALGHHLYWDGKGGYPRGLDLADEPLKPIIDIVTCADCMDAATDGVGRSYRGAKTLDEYLAEVAQGAGTRYAPYLPELLADPAVRADLDELLGSGRERLYRDTYQLLRTMSVNSLE